MTLRELHIKMNIQHYHFIYSTKYFIITQHNDMNYHGIKIKWHKIIFPSSNIMCLVFPVIWWVKCPHKVLTVKLMNVGWNMIIANNMLKIIHKTILKCPVFEAALCLSHTNQTNQNILIFLNWICFLNNIHASAPMFANVSMCMSTESRSNKVRDVLDPSDLPQSAAAALLTLSYLGLWQGVCSFYFCCN